MPPRARSCQVGRLLISGDYMRAELPDLPEMMEAGFGLTDALAIWSKLQNAPRLSGTEARLWITSAGEGSAKEQTEGCGPPSPALDNARLSSPNVIQFSPQRAR
jgi:hypothetical protein